MDIRTFIKTHDRAFVQKVADQANTTFNYLEILAGNHRRPSPALAKRLHQASKGKLALSAMRPDIWGEAGNQ